jgi:hypothetical protein
MKKIAVSVFVLMTVLFSCSVSSDNSEILKSVSTNAAVTSAPKVILSHARAFDVNIGSVYREVYVTGEIDLENIAYVKEVAVHYTTGSNVWKDATAYYRRSIPGNREIWGFSIKTMEVPFETVPVMDMQFAVRYTVNGVTYWDNNSSKDYKVSYRSNLADTNTSNVALGKKETLVEKANYGTSYAGMTLSVQSCIKNLGYTKDIQIVYTTDNWATSSTAPMRFIKTYAYDTSIERWEGNPMIYSAYGSTGPIPQTVTFYVKYTVNGVTYYDNNGGMDYTQSIGNIY